MCPNNYGKSLRWNRMLINVLKTNEIYEKENLNPFLPQVSFVLYQKISPLIESFKISMKLLKCK